MNKNFKQKYEDGTLLESLISIYDKICILHASVGFLSHYSSAFLSVSRIYELNSSVNNISTLIEKVAVDLQNITGSSKSVEDRNCFLPEELCLKKSCSCKYERNGKVWIKSLNKE